MENLRIPETATESYLEHLETNITRQLQKTNNSKVKAHLHGMLREVHRRLKKFRQDAQQESDQDAPASLEVLLLTDDIMEETPPEIPVEPQALPAQMPAPLFPEASQPSAGDDDVFMLTDIMEDLEELPAEEDPLSTKERRVFKDRLKDVIDKFQAKKNAFPQQPTELLLTDVIEEVNQEAPIDDADLSAEQHEKIKQRLKALLQAFQSNLQEQEASAPTFQDTLTQMQRIVSDDDAELPLGEMETIRFFSTEQAAAVSAPAVALPLSPDDVFAEVCEKVGQGEPLALFRTLDLSPREKEMLKALVGHLSSYKGLKKQQSFEMQHLTARSIHELDQIFKTYQIQGYLKAELNNVYNRLLNLRSRFSILLS